MKIKVLGSGCANCKKLEANTKVAVDKLRMDSVEFEKVEELEDIIAYGVMRTPALVVDEKVILSGRVPTVEEIMKLLK